MLGSVIIAAPPWWPLPAIVREEGQTIPLSRGLLREGPPVKFAWIQTGKASYPITKLCRWLGVTPSGFYAWRQRPESTHAREDRRLKVLVHASFAESKQRYGSPRIHEDLIEQDERVSRKRVIRLMQEDGLKARARKRFKSHDDERSRPAGGRESARSAVHGRRAESALGRRHDRVRHRRERQAVSRRHPRPVLAVRRRLGRQRRQRSPPDDQGARDGAEATVSRTSACCTTPTRAARTRARTTKRCSTRAASPAA